ncbi:MAG TPA: serine hydrolase domain-containing protein [Gammaproteobacteria bacterium]|nr:serine hydrolase domain-containing protein [Gammaproteobacteria bacterium]
MFLKYGKSFILLIFSFLFMKQVMADTPSFPRGTASVMLTPMAGVRTDLLKGIAPLIQKSIAEGKYPGAIVLIAHHGHIIYRGVFGNRRILPHPAPMTFNTIFDLASLTKVVATTPAIMQLIEEGKLELDAPVKKYWPEFAAHGKQSVTIRELLTHTSGLPEGISSEATHRADVLQDIINMKLNHPPGTHYLYSDINFVVLALLVERLSHQPFAIYTQNHIFKPLHMTDTAFLPNAHLRDRIAPTEIVHHTLRWGVAQDPLAYSMGGVSGNAGLFSSATDLGIYAQCLLNDGRMPSTGKNKKPGYLLGPLTVLKMTTAETSPAFDGMRSLGWDIDSAYSDRGTLFPLRSFGHTGWTGTSLWIDPVTDTWIVVLTSRLHAARSHHNQIVEDRRTLSTMVAASITDTSLTHENNTGEAELARAYPTTRWTLTNKDHG